MAIVLEAITHVWFAGRLIAPGDKFSAADDFGKKLIQGGSAKVHNSLEELSAQAKKLGASTKTGLDETQKTFMSFKVDELKALAESNEVELSAEDNTKSEIIQRLIEADVSPNEANL